MQGSVYAEQGEWIVVPANRREHRHFSKNGGKPDGQGDSGIEGIRKRKWAVWVAHYFIIGKKFGSGNRGFSQKLVLLMSMAQNGHIQEIMLRFLNGESSDEEAKALQEWIDENPSNKDEFELTRRLWTDSGDAVLLPVDTDKAWQQVSAQTIGKQAKVVRLFPWKRVVAIAASVILIVGGYYFFNQSRQTQWNVTLADNGNKKIELPDGTQIMIRKGSRLSVPDDYGDGRREVKIEGEAFFEVKHDAKNPFAVLTAKSIIRDIGTAFLVHSSDSLEEVTVMEGEVSFAVRQQNEIPLLLKAGESAVLKNNIPRKATTDTANVLSWKSGILKFNNTPLLYVVKDLEDFYEIEMVLPGELSSVQITAEFRNEPMEQVLKELQLFTGLKFERSGKVVVISK